MNRIFSLLFSWIASSLFASPIEQAHCRPGSEGPKPLNEIQLLQTKPQQVPVRGPVREFLISDDFGKTIWYRNFANEVRELKEIEKTDRLLTHSQQPLARILPPDRKHLIVEGSGWTLALNPLQWFQWTQYPTVVRHLFWGPLETQKSTLYSIAQDSNYQRYALYRARGSTPSQKICTVNGLRLAEGHEYPHVFFYSIRNQKISFYQLDLSTCTFTQQIDFVEPLIGNVLKVYRFQKAKAIFMHLQHPSHDLLYYQEGQGCHYFRSNHFSPIVPSTRVPLVLLSLPHRPTVAVNFQKAVKATVFGSTELLFTARDTALAEDKSLYLNSLLAVQNKKQRLLFELNIRELMD